MSKYIFVTGMILITCIRLHAQHLNDYFVQHFTDENGLPQNSIKSIAEDENGFIWVCTENGLARFDGNAIERFSKPQINFASSRFISFFADENGNGLYCSNDKWDLVSIKDGIPSVIDPANNNWFRHFLKSPIADSIQHVIKLPNDFHLTYIKKTVFHSSNQTYFECDNQNIRLIKNGQTLYNVPYDRTLFHEFFLLQSNLIGVRNDGSYDVHDTVGSIKKQIPGFVPQKKNLNSKVDMHLWWNVYIKNQAILYFQGTFYQIEMDKNGFVQHTEILSGFNIDVEKVSAAYFDEAEQKFYLGSYADGMYIFSKKNFKTIRADKGTDIYYALMAHDNQRIVTAKGYVFDRSNNTVNYFPLFDEANISDGYNMAKDDSGNIYVKHGHFITALDGKTFQKTKQYCLPDAVVGLYFLKGKLWIGVKKKGLYVLDTHSENATPVFENKIPADIKFMVSGQNCLWLGTTNGLMHYNLVTKRLSKKIILPGKNIRSLYVTNQNQVWITTYGDGFFLSENDVLTQFPLDNQQYLSESHCIIEDKNGFFWISTNKGLFQFLKSDLLRYAANQQTDLYYAYYDKSSGILSNEFNGGCQPCATQMPDGSFSFPSINGLVVFNPDSIKQQFLPKKIFIDAIFLNDENISVEKLQALTQDFDQLNFHISYASTLHTNDVPAYYSLTQMNEAPVWYKVQQNGIISLSALRPGDYQLTVRKPHGFGGNSYAYKEVLLSVPFRWYQTKGFQILVCLALILGIWTFVKLRVRYVKMKNRQLQQIIDSKTTTLTRKNKLQQNIIHSVSHDIRTPLKYQLLLSRNMILDFESSNKQDLMETAKSINENTYRLNIMVDNLLNYMKVQVENGYSMPTAFNLHALIEEKILIYKDIASRKNTLLTNSISKQTMIHSDIQLIGIIVHNLLDNAVKHTRNGTVQIALTAMDSGFCKLSIRDTGQGLNASLQHWINEAYTEDLQKPDSENAGMGLLVVKELAHLIGSSLQVISTGAGTEFTLELSLISQ